MFTSRAEHRLLLRIDNADLRLTPTGRQVGLVDDERWEMFEARRSRLDNNLRILDQTLVRSAEGGRVPASQMLKRPEVRLAQMVSDQLISLEIDEHRAGVDIASAETSIKCAGYLRGRKSEIERGRRDERHRSHEFPLTRFQVCRGGRAATVQCVQTRWASAPHSGVTPQPWRSSRPTSAVFRQSASERPNSPFSFRPSAGRWRKALESSDSRLREVLRSPGEMESPDQSHRIGSRNLARRGNARSADYRAAHCFVADSNNAVGGHRPRIRRRFSCASSQNPPAGTSIDDGGGAGPEGSISARGGEDVGASRRRCRASPISGASFAVFQFDIVIGRALKADDELLTTVLDLLTFRTVHHVRDRA